jgi:acetoacetyl-CoA synthetase
MNCGSGTARIVRLTTGEGGPCFFLIPGTGGKIDGFANLAPYLDIPNPVFAIEARGIDETSLPDADVEQTAYHYIAQIRAVQPTGPYFLLGHSYGGLVALEMAQSLVRAGERIACLIMLDTPTPEKTWPLRFYLKSRGAKVRRSLAALAAASLTDSLTSFRRKLSLRAQDLNRMPANLTIGGNVARVLLAHGIARENYRPAFYAGKVMFFRPSHSPGGYEALWHGLIPDMDVLTAAGGHLSMIEPPHVRSLAADVSECVRKSTSEATTAPVYAEEGLRL